jgi:hypothetical protein
MMVRGGASLAELNASGHVEKIIGGNRYDVVILQERGGDVICTLKPRPSWDEECQSLLQSHLALAKAAHAMGAKVVYLGTYQTVPEVSRRLVMAERKVSEEMGASYAEVSETMANLRKSHRDLPWLYKDGGHPGIAASALMALSIDTALNLGGDVGNRDLCLSTPMYTPKLTVDEFTVDAVLNENVGKVTCLLSASELRLIDDAVSHRSTSDDRTRVEPER